MDLIKARVRLREAIQTSGKFKYGYKSINAKERLEGYNWLRHAGALWVLTDNYRRCHKDPLLETAMSYVVNKIVNEKETVATIENTDWKSGLVGILILPMLNMGINRLAQKLAYGALKHQNEDGTFTHKINADGSASDFESDYYTGELLFGLLSVCTAVSREGSLPSFVPHISTGIFTTDKQAKIDKAARKLLDWCLDNNYGIDIQSHWMMYALLEALRHTPYRTQEVIDLATKIAYGTVKNANYRDAKRSTPIACRMELFGVFSQIAAIAWAKYNIKVNITDKLKKHVQKDYKLIAAYYHRGYFIKGAQSDEWRIDYNQHALAGIKLTAPLR